MKIGIAVSTYNRPEAITNSLPQIYRYMPKDSELVVVQDFSDRLISHADFTFPERSGIPRVKNKCLEILMGKGCTDIFLFDDDTLPKRKDWHLPYINSPYPHLCYTFIDRGKKLDEQHKKHNLGNGCMMYIRRSVIDKIGGFDTSFGLGKYEHNQFSNRAYASGLIPWPYIDVIRSENLLYCMDQNGSIKRTLSQEEQRALRNNGAMHFDKTKFSEQFIDYKI